MSRRRPSPVVQAGPDPGPMFLAGSPDPWTMTRREWIKHTRQRYVVADRIWVRKQVGRGLPGSFASLDDLAQTGARTITFRDRRFIGCHDRPQTGSSLPVYEVLMKERSTVFPLFDHVGAMLALGDLGGRLVAEPPWYPDFVEWVSGEKFRFELGSELSNREYWQWERSPARDRNTGDLAYLFCGYAADRGHAVLIEDYQRRWILDPSAIDSIRLVTWDPEGYHEAMARMAEDHDLTLEVRVDAALEKGDEDLYLRSLAGVRRALDLLLRINRDLRQRDHDLRQDAELDLMSIQAIGVLWQRLGEAMAGVPVLSWAKRFLVAARSLPMPGPGAAGRPRAPHQAGWPDALVELSQATHAGDPLEIVRALVEAVDQHEDAVAHETSPMKVRTLMVPARINEDMRSLLCVLGWQRGSAAVRAAQAVDW